MHLLLPLLGSFLFVGSLILAKKAGRDSCGDAGVGTVTVLFMANQCSAVAFSCLWLLGGTIPSIELLWQPLLIAALFIAGLAFTFAAIGVGDVSIATPIFGVKVVLVAALLTALGLQDLPASVWFAAFMATLGIGLIQWTGRGQPKRVLTTIALATSAAVTYATFDVLVQRWAPAWGAGRFLPIVFWFVGLLSLGMAPWVEYRKIANRRVSRFLFPAAILMALQAICIVITLSMFGDAARVNVVYSLRAMWSVLLAWMVARVWGGSEAHLSRSTMLTRLAGAGLLTLAVASVVLS